MHFRIDFLNHQKTVQYDKNRKTCDLVSHIRSLRANRSKKSAEKSITGKKCRALGTRAERDRLCAPAKTLMKKEQN